MLDLADVLEKALTIHHKNKKEDNNSSSSDSGRESSTVDVHCPHYSDGWYKTYLNLYTQAPD